MGFLFGTASFSRFLVNSKPPKNYEEEFPIRIAQNAFRKLDENSDEERSTGWVNVMDIFDNQFPNRDYFKDPYLVLSWRVDTRKVPSKALRQSSREAEDKIKDLENLEWLSKKRRQEIREGVLVQLLKRAIPLANTYDMVWSLDAQTVLFGSTNNRLCGEFTEFFLKTFDLNLTPVFPYIMASQALESQGSNLDILDGLHPINLMEDTE